METTNVEDMNGEREESWPDELRDPLSCEADLKTAKSESFEHLLIKNDEGCGQKSKLQCSICYLKVTSEEDLKSTHRSYGADHPRGFQQKVEINK